MCLRYYLHLLRVWSRKLGLLHSSSDAGVAPGLLPLPSLMLHQSSCYALQPLQETGHIASPRHTVSVYFFQNRCSPEKESSLLFIIKKYLSKIRSTALLTTFMTSSHTKSCDKQNHPLFALVCKGWYVIEKQKNCHIK